MGKISDDNDKVFKVSLDGYNVDDATPEECAVHSGFDYPKMEEELVGVKNYTFPASPGTGTITILTINHNLGYKPMAQCFMEDVDAIFRTEFATLPYVIDLFSSDRFFCFATTTQFKIGVSISNSFNASFLAGHEFNFKYQIWIND